MYKSHTFWHILANYRVHFHKFIDNLINGIDNGAFISPEVIETSSEVAENNSSPPIDINQTFISM